MVPENSDREERHEDECPDESSLRICMEIERDSISRSEIDEKGKDTRWVIRR
jgi:hypothetical protein